MAELIGFSCSLRGLVNMIPAIPVKKNHDPTDKEERPRCRFGYHSERDADPWLRLVCPTVDGHVVWRIGVQAYFDPSVK